MATDRAGNLDACAGQRTDIFKEASTQHFVANCETASVRENPATKHASHASGARRRRPSITVENRSGDCRVAAGSEPSRAGIAEHLSTPNALATRRVSLSSDAALRAFKAGHCDTRPWLPSQPWSPDASGLQGNKDLTGLINRPHPGSPPDVFGNRSHMGKTPHSSGASLRLTF